MDERRFPLFSDDRMTSEQRMVAAAIAAGPRGDALIGPFNALLRSPGLCDPAQRLGAHVRFSSAIPARLNELAIIMVGRKWSAQFEFWAHRKLAIEAGLSPAICDAIAAGTRPDPMREDEAEIYEFCTEILSTGHVSDANYRRIVERHGERGVIDLVGAIGYYGLVSMILNLDRVPLPDGEPLPLQPL